ncbi:MAG: tetratricopeptide repeat protein [Myxococcota bacterium]
METTCCADEHFRAGIVELEAGRFDQALEHFRTAQKMDPARPTFRSYFGLCLGLTERRFDKALELCRSAAKEEFYNAGLYHNLARVHLAFGFKAEAIRYLRRGLMIDPKSQPILLELEELGRRRGPVLAFLRRQNPLNRLLGRLRSRMRGRPAELEPIHPA